MGKYYMQRKTKSGYLICVVPMCQTKKSTSTLKTFEFPSDLKRRNEWISAIVDATVKNEEQSSIEDLYSLENRRMELEMEISSILGDHSYVCARHFLPEDIIVHPNVCRLTTNAVPSVFKNYPIELPRQFFKKICETARSIHSDYGILELDSICEQSDLNDSQSEYMQEITVYDPLKIEIIDVRPDSPEPSVVNSTGNPEIYPESFRSCYVVSRGTNTKLKYTGVSNSYLSKGKIRKKLRLLQTKHKQLQNRLTEVENKLKLYNIDSLETDAANKNEDAIFLLDMLTQYAVFEKTRKEILSSQRKN